MDRFGRVVDQRWVSDNNTPDTTADDVDVDRFGYIYDRNSNRLSRDWTSTGAPTNVDEAYFYDGLDRLTKMNRGTLAGGTISDASAAHTRRWDRTANSGLDALGNWTGVTTERAVQVRPAHDPLEQATELHRRSSTRDARQRVLWSGTLAPPPRALSVTRAALGPTARALLGTGPALGPAARAGHETTRGLSQAARAGR